MNEEGALSHELDDCLSGARLVEVSNQQKEALAPGISCPRPASRLFSVS
jgi:hypothetical protein